MSTARSIANELKRLERLVREDVSSLLSRFPGGNYQDWLNVEVSRIGDLEDVLSGIDHILAHIVEAKNKWNGIALQIRGRLTREQMEEGQRDIMRSLNSIEPVMNNLEQYVRRVF
jgi:hypothetical protein